jgi:hypothetical protein
MFVQQQAHAHAQQQGQQQVHYAWMLQQYSMAAVAAAAAGQPPPLPPPPPPGMGGTMGGSMAGPGFCQPMGWPQQRQQMPWHQQVIVLQGGLYERGSKPASCSDAKVMLCCNGLTSLLIAPPAAAAPWALLLRPLSAGALLGRCRCCLPAGCHGDRRPVARAAGRAEPAVHAAAVGATQPQRRDIQQEGGTPAGGKSK